MSNERETPSSALALTVPRERAGQRLDNFLLGTLAGLPRSLVYRLLRTGRVRVEGRRGRPEERLAGGERILLPPLALPRRPVAEEAPLPAGLAARLEGSLVAEERDYLVIDKPAGLASHGGSGLRLGLIEALRRLRGEPELGLVHRLDRETSGLLLVARRREALLLLHRALRERAVEKRYLALLAGRPARRRLIADQALRRRLGGAVAPDEEGRAAESRFEVLERYREASLCEVRILTGRTHQIRVHAAALGHPVLGDRRYGDFALNRRLARELGLRRLFLHASYLAFPAGGTVRAYSAPLPEELAAVLARLPR